MSSDTDRIPHIQENGERVKKHSKFFIHGIHLTGMELFFGLLIIFLAIVDMFTMYTLFSGADSASADYNLTGVQAWVYSITFAICLEGVPSVLGHSCSVLTDKSRYKKNDKLNATVGFFIALLVMISVFGIAIFIRYVGISKNGGFVKYKEGEYGEFPLHCWLMLSPVITSLVAFLISWIVFRNESISGLQRRVDYLFENYTKTLKTFLEDFHALQEARTILWTSLADHKTMPKRANVYRIESLARIRAKLIENGIIPYQLQVKRYNDSVENLLKELISEIREYSTLPWEIEKIDLNQLIEEFDRGRFHPEDKWNYSESGNDLEKKFSDYINNELLVKQFKNTGTANASEKG